MESKARSEALPLDPGAITKIAAAHELTAFPGTPVVLFGWFFFFFNAIQKETVEEEVSSLL